MTLINTAQRMRTTSGCKKHKLTAYILEHSALTKFFFFFFFALLLNPNTKAKRPQQKGSQTHVNNPYIGTTD